MYKKLDISDNEFVLVVDDQGYAHVLAYYDGSEGVLTDQNAQIAYGTNRSGQWKWEVIHRLLQGSIGTIANVKALLSPSLAIDHQGLAHVIMLQDKFMTACLYCGDSAFYMNAHLLYMTNGSGQWKTDKVKRIKSSVKASSLSAIAVDDKSNVHILYAMDARDTVIPQVKIEYIHNTHGVWQSSTLGSEFGSKAMKHGFEPIAIHHKNNKIHIAYYEYTAEPDTKTMMYATKENDEWVRETIEKMQNLTISAQTDVINYAPHAGSPEGSNHLILVDQSGKPHLIYINDENGHYVVKHATP